MYDVYFGVAIETGFYAFDRRSAMRVSLMRTPPPIERSEIDVLNGNLDGKSFAGINLLPKE